jgi:NAD-dependent dihydropyrimidine dehydrogenase PreA subunit
MTTSTCCAGAAMDIIEGIDANTLRYRSAKCINCGMCLMVCPHAVFAEGERAVLLAHPIECIECGACQMNCPTGAITVNSGVGCAAAMINAALRGSSEVCCGGDSDANCRC